jgi:hypothetical protein
MGRFLKLATGGSGSYVNPSQGFETQGYVIDGSGTVSVGASLTTGSTNNKNASWVPIGSTFAADCSGFFLYAYAGTSTRYIFDISSNNSTANVVSNFMFITASSSYYRVFFPLKIAAGTQLYVKCQSTSASVGMVFLVEGLPTSTTDFPGYDTATTLLAPDTSNTRGNASVNASTSSTAPSFVTAATTAASYGAFIFVPSGAGSANLTAQQAVFELAYGASNTIIGRWPVNISNSSTADFSRGESRLIRTAVASGEAVKYRVWAAGANNGTGDTTIRGALYGFN